MQVLGLGCTNRVNVDDTRMLTLAACGQFEMSVLVNASFLFVQKFIHTIELRTRSPTSYLHAHILDVVQ